MKNVFPQYPHLKRVCNSPYYGRMELLEVHPTSDGFLLGMAKIGTGDGAYMHSVFLGLNPNREQRNKDPQLANLKGAA